MGPEGSRGIDYNLSNKERGIDGDTDITYSAKRIATKRRLDVDIGEPQFSIHFDTNESNLNKRAREILGTVYSRVQNRLDAGYSIEMDVFGYADYRGTKEHNVGLAGLRADTVGDYFEPLRIRYESKFQCHTHAVGEADSARLSERGLQPYRSVSIYVSMDEPKKEKKEKKKVRVPSQMIVEQVITNHPRAGRTVEFTQETIIYEKYTMTEEGRVPYKVKIEPKIREYRHLTLCRYTVTRYYLEYRKPTTGRKIRDGVDSILKLIPAVVGCKGVPIIYHSWKDYPQEDDPEKAKKENNYKHELNRFRP